MGQKPQRSNVTALIQCILKLATPLRLLLHPSPSAFFDLKAIPHPFPLFAQLRSQGAVVQIEQPYEDTKQKVWLVTRMTEAVDVLKDHKHFSRQRTAVPKFRKRMNAVDDPDHKRLRKLVSQAFTPRYVQSLRPHIQHTVDELLDKVQAQGHMDIVQDFAYPLSIRVISDMLGIAQKDCEQLRPWIEAFSGGVRTSAKDMKQIKAFYSYITQLIMNKRSHLQDDLISHLIQAEEAGDALDPHELVEMVLLLIWAGSETTANFIGLATLMLLDNPIQLATLQANPTLIPNAVEELLRFNSPVSLTPLLFATEDCKIGKQPIQKGEAVMVALASANRDESQISQPDELIVSREPTNHITFGQGIHICLGAPLVRIEADIAFTSLLKRMPDLKLMQPRASLHWRNNFAVRGLTSLPVTF